MIEEFEVKIGRVSLEGFSIAELVEELLTRTDYNVVYKHDDGTLLIDLASIIPLMETSKLVEELSKRDGVLQLHPDDAVRDLNEILWIERNICD